jgi:hypothetical protein
MTQYMKGLDKDRLPQTILDAIEVAKSIPVRYLWVDALCILQDSEEDKTVEIANMENIYRNSFVTIVAASSYHASRGFLQRRLHRPARPAVFGDDSNCRMSGKEFTVPFRISESKFGTMTLGDLDCDHEYKEIEEPINQRAWTLQEQLMAPRLLLYASHTLQWRCKTTTSNLGDSLHHEQAQIEEWSFTIASLSRPTPDRTKAVHRWIKLVTIYSQRHMSLPDDKLPGMQVLIPRH